MNLLFKQLMGFLETWSIFCHLNEEVVLAEKSLIFIKIKATIFALLLI